jgi:hypothetical protein
MNAIISIGRGRQTDPNYLGNAEWSAFQAYLDESIQRFGHIVSRTTGYSTSDSWGTEQSYTVVLEDLVSSEIPLLRSALASLATLYSQDAIALTVGQTDLVGQA